MFAGENKLFKKNPYSNKMTINITDLTTLTLSDEKIEPDQA